MSDAAKYTVAWICALIVEQVAAISFLDSQHEPLASAPKNDNNNYTLGQIGDHNIVIAVSPDAECGTNSAASVANDLTRTFTNVRVCLLVGIGGGAPSPKADIRLGDVVVSRPTGQYGGVLQYDFGKTIQGQEFLRTGFLDQPRSALRAAVASLRAVHEMSGNELSETVNDLIARNRRLKKRGYGRPDESTDRLFQSQFVHNGPKNCDCSKICDGPRIHREPRRKEDDEDAVQVHYGLIASANEVMKDALIRDKLASELGVLCFEMEAAGLMNRQGALIVRGICDYADTHKSDAWQPYAAMTAAAYAKQLLRKIVPAQVSEERRLVDVLHDINDGLRHVHLTTTKITEKVIDIDEQMKMEKIHEWLSPPDPYSIFKNIEHQRNQNDPNTGDWLLKSSVFKSWSSEPASCLWLTGIPGAGKSNLAAKVISHRLRSCEGKNRTAMFFFDHQSATRQTLESLLASLIDQLYLPANLALRNKIQDAYKRASSHSSRPSVTEMKGLLAFALETLDDAWIIIDTLDESPAFQGREIGQRPARSEVLDWIYEVIMAKSPSLHLLLTSRDEADISNAIGGIIRNSHTLHLSEISGVQEDISLYIRARLKGREFNHWEVDSAALEMIINRLEEGAEKMFRWVACQLDLISGCLDRQSLEETLDSLPPTLDATYERILHNIPPQRKVPAIALLQVLLCSSSPITITQANEIVAIDHKLQRLDPLRRLRRSKDAALLCPSLLTLVDDERSDIEATLVFSHTSVRDYLQSSRLPESVAAAFSPGTLHRHVVLKCLYYLYRLRDEWGHSNATLLMPWVSNAATIWIRYVKGATDDDQKVQKAVLRFLRTGPVLSWQMLVKFNANEICEFFDDGFAHLGYGFSERDRLRVARYCIARCGLLYEVPELLSCTDMRSEQNEFPKPLYTAAWAGHIDVCKLLLHRDAGIDETGGTRGTPLQAAIHNTHVDLAIWLLENGASPNPLGPRTSESPLTSACRLRHRSLIDRLMVAGASLDPPGVKDSSPLKAALGMPQWIPSFDRRELIERDKLASMLVAEINKTKTGQQKALLAAVEYNRYDLAESLIRNGASPGANESKALVRAVSLGQLQMSRLLIAHGAEPKVRSGALLSQAIRAQALDVCCLLLETGSFSSSDICTPNKQILLGRQKSPLHAALDLLASRRPLRSSSQRLEAEISHEQAETFVTTLMDRTEPEAMVNHQELMKPAIKARRNDILTLLIATGADVNSSNGLPILCAAKYGCLEQLCLLLRHGARADYGRHESRDHGHGPLHIAAQTDLSGKVFQCVLDSGADVNLLCDRSLTPLQYACSRGNLKAIRLLTARGALVDSRSEHAGSALECAIRPTTLSVSLGSSASLKIVETMVHMILRARMDRKDDVLAAALQLATSERLQSIVDVILHAQGSGKASADSAHDALLTALETDDVEVLDTFKRHGIGSASTKTNLGNLLCRSASLGHINTVRVLLSWKVNVNSLYDRSKAEYFTERRKRRTVSCLSIVKVFTRLRRPSDCLKGQAGTPLTYAVRGGHSDVVKLLMEQRDIDESQANCERFQALLNCQPVQSPPIDFDGISKPSTAVLTPLHGTDFAVQTTPAMRVAANTQTALGWKLDTLIKMRLDGQLEIDARDVLGRGMWHYVAISQQPRLIEWYHGIDLQINRPDNHGWTPLHWLVHKCANFGNLALLPCVRAVLELGADICATDEQKWLPADVACYINKPALAQVLAPNPDYAFEAAPQAPTGAICDACDTISS